MRTSGTLEISTKMSIFSKIPQKMKIVHPSISMLESLSVASKTLGTSSLSVFTQKKSLVIFGYYQYFGIFEHIFTTHVSKSSEKTRCSGKNEYLHNIFTNCSPKSCCSFTVLCLWDVLDTPRVVLLRTDTYPPRPTRKHTHAPEVLIFSNILKRVCRHNSCTTENTVGGQFHLVGEGNYARNNSFWLNPVGFCSMQNDPLA